MGLRTYNIEQAALEKLSAKSDSTLPPAQESGKQVAAATQELVSATRTKYGTSGAVNVDKHS